MHCTFPDSFKPFIKKEIEQSISCRFEQQVSVTPQALAISYKQETITYERLNIKANRVARAINVEVKNSHQRVGLMIDQGIDLVAAVMGVLKSGNVYVPFDCRQPLDSLGNSVSDLQPCLILYDSQNAEKAEKFIVQSALLRIEKINNEGSGENLEQKPLPESLAYIYLTSGTAGKSKGVMDCHRNVLHNIMRYTNTLGIAPEDRLSLIQYSSFSGSVSSMFGALTNGATLCPCDIAKQGAQIIPAWIKQEGITIFHSLPSIFRYVATAGGNYESVRIVRLEGDRSTVHDAQLFQKYFNNNCTLVNGLGATECGLVRQFFLRNDDPVDQQLPIGFPVIDMDIFVSDEQGFPVRNGVIGEIRVESNYLALGYWSDPEKTARAFTVSENGSRVYKTGDLGRMGNNQCLEHLGRIDDQLKISGQTVNIAELEHQIGLNSSVRLVGIKGYLDNYQETQLAAYIVPHDPFIFSEALFRQQLTDELPDFMIPSAIRVVEYLPMSENGKIDRKSLLDPTFYRPVIDAPFITPKTPTEKLLALVWSQVLEVHPIGVLDNFLSLGGDSLKAARVIMELKKHSIMINFVTLYEYHILESLAGYLQNGQNKIHEFNKLDQRAQRQRSAMKDGLR